MIKISNGRECGEPIRIGTMPDMESFRAALTELGTRAGLPIEVQVDEVKIGKGLSFGGPQYRCIVVYNREHRSGYYFHVFAVEKHYNEDYVQLYLGGSSVGANAVARFERQEKGFIRDSLLSQAKTVQKHELIYQDRLLELIKPAFELAVKKSRNRAREDEIRRQREREEREASLKRKREAEEAARLKREREAEEAARLKREQEAEEAARLKREQDAEQARQKTDSPVSSGLREAGRGPAQAPREYLGGSREDCSTYRYRNGTMVWTSKTVEAVRKHSSCRKCGKPYEVGKGRGSQRFCCSGCGHRIEVTC